MAWGRTRGTEPRTLEVPVAESHRRGRGGKGEQITVTAVVVGGRQQLGEPDDGFVHVAGNLVSDIDLLVTPFGGGGQLVQGPGGEGLEGERELRDEGDQLPGKPVARRRFADGDESELAEQLVVVGFGVVQVIEVEGEQPYFDQVGVVGQHGDDDGPQDGMRKTEHRHLAGQSRL